MTSIIGAVLLVGTGSSWFSLSASASESRATSPNGCALVDNPTPEHHIECRGMRPPTDNLASKDLSYADFTESDLTNVVFVISNLTNATFAGANLSKAIISDDFLHSLGQMTTFGHTNFSRAMLTDTKLEWANLGDANFTGAHLVRTYLGHAELSGANLTGVSSGGIFGTPASLPPEWALIKGYLIGPTAVLSGADLSGADLSTTTLTRVKSGRVTGTPSALPMDWRLTRGFLIGPSADLSGADLNHVDLPNAHLQEVDLSGADLTYTNLTDASLQDADLSRANLRNAMLLRADLGGVKWDHTICPDNTNSDNDGGTCMNNLRPWTYIAINFQGRVCSGSYGREGSQSCRGEFRDWAGPDPPLDYWPFSHNLDGSWKAARNAGQTEVTLEISAPRGEIDGSLPSGNSDRYTVTRGIIDTKNAFVSPPENPRIKAGDKGGPLSADVRGEGAMLYDIEIRGWVRVALDQQGS